MFQDYANSK